MAFDFQQGVLAKLASGTLEELSFEDSFAFGCGAECMGRCCRNITILLEPWDVEVMARHLGLPGQQFFFSYCAMELDREKGWPVFWLAHAKEGACAFMLEDGRCSIYPARPGNCRTYPLGRAVRYIKEGEEERKEERIFKVEKMAFCLGHRSGRIWTVREWLEDAGALTYYRMSDQYTSLVDYAMRQLNCREWMTKQTVQVILPFLFAPDMLRGRLGVSEREVGHEEFHRRRMEAVRLVLTDLAAGLGYAAPAGQDGPGPGGSMMDRVRKVLAGGA
mgnify:CR=1 FL=1